VIDLMDVLRKSLKEGGGKSANGNGSEHPITRRPARKATAKRRAAAARTAHSHARKRA